VEETTVCLRYIFLSLIKLKTLRNRHLIGQERNNGLSREQCITLAFMNISHFYVSIRFSSHEHILFLVFFFLMPVIHDTPIKSSWRGALVSTTDNYTSAKNVSYE
jgi:hypothetical protein